MLLIKWSYVNKETFLKGNLVYLIQNLKSKIFTILLLVLFSKSYFVVKYLC